MSITTLSTTSTANFQNTPTALVSTEAFVSDEAVKIFQWVLYTCIIPSIVLFGIATNTINVICLVKQGLKDSINISLLGLTVSDLGCLLPLIWTCICMTPAFHESDLPFDSVGVQYLTGGWLHVIFTRITSWITAFITLERCLCITMPLKIKNIMTVTRATIIVACIYIISIGSSTPFYYVNRLGLTFIPERNKTIIGLVYTEGREKVEEISFAINNLFIPLTAFLTVIVCTVTLVAKLRSKTKWRMKSTDPKNVDAMSDRDQKVSKMVVMISTLYIACSIPQCLTIFGMIVVPGLAIDGPQRNLIYVLAALVILLESMNSSMNIIFYFQMSSRYRATFLQLFGMDQKS